MPSITFRFLNTRGEQVEDPIEVEAEVVPRIGEIITLDSSRGKVVQVDHDFDSVARIGRWPRKQVITVTFQAL